MLYKTWASNDIHPCIEENIVDMELLFRIEQLCKISVLIYFYKCVTVFENSR